MYLFGAHHLNLVPCLDLYSPRSERLVASYREKDGGCITEITAPRHCAAHPKLKAVHDH